MPQHDEKADSPRATPSICENVLDEYKSGNDTLANLLEHHHIEVRDFMVLSFVCDQGSMTPQRIASTLGLSLESTMTCIERLRHIELVIHQVDETGGAITGVVRPSEAGSAIAQRIHSNEGESA